MVVICDDDDMTCSDTAGDKKGKGGGLTVRRRVVLRAPWSGISTAAPCCTPFWRFVVVD